MSREKLWDAWNRPGGPRYPHEKVIQFVLRTFPPSGGRALRILDLGCGSGVHTRFLAAEGFETYARDLSAVGVANTRADVDRQGLRADVAVGSVERIDFPDGFFDAVICVGVLDCAGQAALLPAIREVVRVLKPGGWSLLVFASDTDFRVTGANEHGLHGFSDAEVRAARSAVCAQLEHFWMDRYITTYRDKALEQNDHLVTLRKAMT